MANALGGAVLQAFSDQAQIEMSSVIGDRELLGRFLVGGDEAAFTDLVQRYGRTVWGVCRRILNQEQDAEDAFQAVFLILARQASSIRKGEALGSWLYGVAYRVAMKARQTAGRRRKYESLVPAVPAEPEPPSQAACRELQRLLDEEVQRLAEKYRQPFVLCCLEGMSKSEAALELGWKPGTVSGRLAEARKLLQTRLAKRGVLLSAVLTAGALAENAASAAAPPMLVQATATQLSAYLACNTTSSPLGASVTTLAESVLRTMELAKIKLGVVLALAASVLLGSLGMAGVYFLDKPSGLPAARDPETFLPPPKPLGTPVDEQVFTIAFSPDGKKIITAGALGGLPGQIKMWNVATAKELFSITRVPGVRGVAFAADGQSFVTADFAGAITSRDAKTGSEKTVQKGHTVGINAVAYSPGGSLLVSAGLDKVLKLWDTKLQNELRVFSGHTDYVLSVAYFHHSPLFVSGSKDNTARIWDVDTGTEKFLLRGHASAVEAVAVSPDDRRVATASWDQTIQIWDTSTGKQVGSWKANEGPVLALAFNPTGDLLASGGGDGFIRLWDIKTQKEVGKLERHDAAIRCLEFSRDGKRLASGSSDKTAKVWDMASRKLLATLQTNWSAGKHVVAIAYSPDGQILAVATKDKSLHTRDAQSGDVINVMLGHLSQVTCLAFSPDGQTIASGGEDKVVKIWDRTTGQLKLTFSGHAGAVRALAFAPDGKSIASAGDDKTIALWDPRTGKEMNRLKGHEGAIRTLAFAPGDVGLLASGSDDQTVRLWALGNQTGSGSLFSHAGIVRAVAFAPDGKTLASAGDKGVVQLWDLNENRIRLELKGHNGPVWGLAYTPAGRTLVSISGDETAIVWDPALGKIRSTLTGHQRDITCLAIDPLGNDLITGSSDTSLLRWRGGRISEVAPLSNLLQPPPTVKEVRVAQAVGQVKESYAREYYHSFKDSTGIAPEFLLMGKDAEQKVSFEPGGGVRITLPAGTNNDGPVVGVGTRFGIQGDFEITAGYQILHLPSPADAGSLGTRFSIMTGMRTQQPSLARVTRAVRSGANQFISWQSLWDNDLGKKVDHIKADPAKANSGKLRLVRTGALLSYYKAEGADEQFTFLALYPTTEEAVGRVSLVGQTGGPKAKLDVIFTDLRIRADSLPGLADSVTPPVTATAEGGSLWGAGIIFALVLFSSIGVIWYFFRRIGRPGALLAGTEAQFGSVVETAGAQAQSTNSESTTFLISFPCSSCGKTLRVKSTLGGRTGKCPHCGEAVVAPQLLRADGDASSILKGPLCWVIFLLLTPAFGFAQMRNVLEIDFRAGIPKQASVTLYGPGVTRMANYGDQGLRFSLPEGRPEIEPVGAEVPLRLQGDFEVELGYQLLAIGGPPPPGGSGINLTLLFESPDALKAILSRMRKGPELTQVGLYQKAPANGETFGANRVDTGPDGKERYNNSTFRAESRAGRLRMVRHGAQVEFWAADGGDSFHLMCAKEIGVADVSSIRLVATTNYRAVTLDLVFTDLVVKADNSTATAAPQVSVPEAVQGARSKLLLPVILSAAAGITMSALVLLWLIQKRRMRWPFSALLIMIAFTYACSIYANCSFAVTEGSSYRFLPPFKPYVNENMNDHLGAEYFNIARSLASGQGFSNPFPEPTGPTAWMPPALSVIEAGLLSVCGNDKDLVTAIVVLLQVNVLIGTGLLVLALTWQTIPRGWPLVAAGVFCFGLVHEFHAHFQFTHDSWLILLMVDLLVAGLCWFRPLHGWQRGCVWGLFGGLCALVNPIVAMVWGIGSFLMSLKQRSWLSMGPAILVAGITLLPWTIRNYAVLGRWIPVKSNLAYELYQSQCLQPDGLLQHSTFGTHPYASASRERQEYKVAGEITFLEHKSKQFWEAVWADPRDFVQRVVARFLGATFWYQPFKRDEAAQRPVVFWLSRLTFPLPFLGLLILAFNATFVRLPSAQWIVMGVYVLYLLPYVGVSYYERYAIPLLAVKVLLVIWGADRLLCLTRYGVKIFAGGIAAAKSARTLRPVSS